jgi:hypothetical protein
VYISTITTVFPERKSGIKYKSMLLVFQKELIYLHVLLELKSIASFISAYFGLLLFFNNHGKPACPLVGECQRRWHTVPSLVEICPMILEIIDYLLLLGCHHCWRRAANLDLYLILLSQFPRKWWKINIFAFSHFISMAIIFQNTYYTDFKTCGDTCSHRC